MSCTIRARYNSGAVLERRNLKWADASETHFAKHGVPPEEVEEALAGPPSSLRKGCDRTLLAYGQAFSGRCLMVVLASAENCRAFVVTARCCDTK